MMMWLLSVFAEELNCSHNLSTTVAAFSPGTRCSSVSIPYSNPSLSISYTILHCNTPLYRDTMMVTTEYRCQINIQLFGEYSNVYTVLNIQIFVLKKINMYVSKLHAM